MKTRPVSPHDVDRRHVLAVCLVALAIAPVVEALRALLALVSVLEPSWYWVFFAVGGSVSGLAMIVAAVLTFRRPAFPWVVGGAVLAFVGHYVVVDAPWTSVALLSTSLVHIGLALVLRPWQSWSIAAGTVAAVGAYLRWSEADAGNLLLLAGSLGLAVAAVRAGLAARLGDTDVIAST